jgi:putative methylase
VESAEEILPRRRSPVQIRLPASPLAKRPQRHLGDAAPRPVRRDELIRRIQSVPLPVDPKAAREQVATPAEAAANLLSAMDRFVGLRGRSVLDLGCGTGRLSVGAALLGASSVTGVEVDESLLRTARDAARAAEVEVDFRAGDVAGWTEPADVVVMNPPFGAQRSHADRPFWDRAFALARSGIGAFSLSVSRSFIARLALDRGAHVVEVEPVPWNLPRTFPHHRAANVRLAVDRWVIETGSNP